MSLARRGGFEDAGLHGKKRHTKRIGLSGTRLSRCYHRWLRAFQGYCPSRQNVYAPKSVLYAERLATGPLPRSLSHS
jgi:hypothetical protein